MRVYLGLSRILFVWYHGVGSGRGRVVVFLFLLTFYAIAPNANIYISISCCYIAYSYRRLSWLFLTIVYSAWLDIFSMHKLIAIAYSLSYNDGSYNTNRYNLSPI